MSEQIVEKSVFVIMPFSATTTCTEDEWTDIFNEVFTPAIHACGYGCERASPSTGNLVKTIITQLRNAWLVLADLTDRNANVFYELGVRHSLSKRTILVAQDSSHIPSDLRGYWWLVYGTRPGGVAKFRREIKKLVKAIESDPDRSDSPVSDFLEDEMLGISSYLTKENIKKLTALFTEMTGIINTLRELRVDSRYTAFLSSNCLELLLTTLYVDVGPALLRHCNELHHALRVIQTGLNRDEAFVDRTQSLAATVLDQVLELRTKLMRGEFIEPSDVSAMVWTPIPSRDGTEGERKNGLYSVSEDLSKINLHDLREHFKGLKGPGS